MRPPDCGSGRGSLVRDEWLVEANEEHRYSKRARPRGSYDSIIARSYAYRRCLFTNEDEDSLASVLASGAFGNGHRRRHGTTSLARLLERSMRRYPRIIEASEVDYRQVTTQVRECMPHRLPSDAPLEPGRRRQNATYTSGQRPIEQAVHRSHPETPSADGLTRAAAPLPTEMGVMNPSGLTASTPH